MLFILFGSGASLDELSPLLVLQVVLGLPLVHNVELAGSQAVDRLVEVLWLEGHLGEAVGDVVSKKDGVASRGVHLGVGGEVVDVSVEGDEDSLSIRVLSVKGEEFLRRKVALFDRFFCRDNRDRTRRRRFVEEFLDDEEDDDGQNEPQRVFKGQEVHGLSEEG